MLSDLPGAIGVVGRLFAAFQDDGGGNQPTAYELRRSEVGRPYAIVSDGRLLHTGVDAGNTLDWLITDVGRRAVASAHPFVVLHAGVVSQHGQGIVMPAPADHGKSTLTTALVRAGCSFLSDEAAPIDPGSGIVQPFPRPIRLSPSSLAVFPGLAESLPAEHTRFRNYQFHLTCDDIRPGSMGEPCSVDVIVTPRYESGAATSLEPLTASECLITLLTQCLNFDRVGASAVPLLANVVEGARCYRLTTGDASMAVEAVLGIID